jgi:hypothetical protein
VTSDRESSKAFVLSGAARGACYWIEKGAVDKEASWIASAEDVIKDFGLASG